MNRLDHITIVELQELLDQTENPTPRDRVLAAIGRKQGHTIETLAEQFDVVEKTIRNWLDRFEYQPLEEAPYDAPRPGGPSKLAATEREQLFDTLQDPPTDLGYDYQAWSPKLLLHYVKAEYDVEYVEGHARYLLDEAGLAWRTARPRNHDADPEQEADFKDTVKKKRPELTGKTVVVVDQFTKRAGTVQR